jgi:hypothetical protein
MVSKRLVVASVAIALIVVIAGLIYFITKPPPQTVAESMILAPKEIGEDWIGLGKLNPVNMETYPNQTSVSSQWIQNDSIVIELVVYVFETKNDSIMTYTERTDLVQNDPYNANFTHFSIGDDLCYFEQQDYPVAYLLLGHTMTILWTDDDNFSSKAWYKISILEIATLQAEKIDQYLAQHPGAS